jgi:hypothetical protein
VKPLRTGEWQKMRLGEVTYSYFSVPKALSNKRREQNTFNVNMLSGSQEK